MIGECSWDGGAVIGECLWDGGAVIGECTQMGSYKTINSLSLCGRPISLSSFFETALRVMLLHCVKKFCHSLNCTDEESQKGLSNTTLPRIKLKQC